jgi:hypothetical protein
MLFCFGGVVDSGASARGRKVRGLAGSCARVNGIEAGRILGRCVSRDWEMLFEMLWSYGVLHTRERIT